MLSLDEEKMFLHLYLYMKGNAHIKPINIYTLAKFSHTLARYARLDVRIHIVILHRFAFFCDDILIGYT